MAKNTIQIDVQASTKNASAELKKLQAQADSMSKMQAFGKGLQNMTGASIPGLGSIGWLAKFAGPAGALAGVVGGIKAVKDGIDALVESGKPAQRNFEAMNTSLETLARNFGKTSTRIPEVTKELQLMAANGVNSMESITSAMNVLTVAYKGNVNRASDMTKKFDDIAAGTGKDISQFATLTAKIEESGAEYKDFNSLARQGIPIWNALATVLNTTADNAKQMAKEGRIGVEDWNRAVDELAKNYKGVSEAMSSKTLEGAQSTFEASKSLATQGAAAGYSEERIRGLNELSDTLQKWANHENWQSSIKSLGMVSAEAENVADEFKQMAGIFTSRAMIRTLDIITGGSFSELSEQQRQLGYNQTVADLTRGYAEAKEGKLSADQIRNLIDTIAETRFELNEEGNTGWEKRLDELNALLDKQVQIEQQQVQRMASGEAIMKYGTLEQKLANVSGKEGVPILLDPAEIEGAVEKIKKGLMEGTYSDPEMMSKALETLTPLLKEYQSAQAEYERSLKQEAETKKKLAEQEAEFQANLDKQYITSKADAARELKSAKEEYDKITADYSAAMQENAFKQSMIEHGQLPKETYNKLLMETSDTSMVRMEESMRKAQDNLAKANERFANFDKNWQESLDMTRRITNGMAKNTFRVSGTFLAG